MHEMQSVVDNDPVAWLSLSLSIMWLRCAKTAKRIEVLFWVETLQDLRNV